MDKETIKDQKPEEKNLAADDKGQDSAEKSPSLDPVKLLSDAQSLFKSITPKSVESLGLPSLFTFDSKEKQGDKSKQTQDKSEEQAKQKSDDAEKPKIYVQPAETKPPHQIANPEQPRKPESPKADQQKANQHTDQSTKSDQEKAGVIAAKDNGLKAAVDSSSKKDAPVAPVLDANQKEIANKLVGRITDSSAPVQEIKDALKKLDNLRDATVTVKNGYSHIDINLMQEQNAAAPKINVGGFKPVQTHLDTHLSFNLTPQKNGFCVSQMEGFSGTVQGPLGKLRYSETTSMFVGKDAYGGFINTTSDLHMRRRIHTSTTTLREQNLPGESPLKAMMQHPDSLKKVESMLRLFQGTEDLSKMGIKRNGTAFDVSSEAKESKHIDLNFTPKPDEKALLKIPVTVKSLDLDKALSASLKQDKDSVNLENIKGITAHVEIGKLKTSIVPTKVEVENDKIKLELKLPDGNVMPVAIPISRLKEAANKLKH